MVEEKSILELQADLQSGSATSEALVAAYLDRIQALDWSGPTLQSVISVNPEAREQAVALDAERRGGRVRGPLHGIPILVKDNIETRELPTTAGSLALKDNLTGRDAPAMARLRDAGAILLGKTNLSEWANFRSTSSISGWSGVGGLVRNPYALDRNACGSSSGSGVAAAASLSAAAIGTETSGSVVCPATVNGVVGLKPTLGLISRSRVVPIAASMDTIGPMTRDVMDAAILLTALAGSDPGDPATADADRHKCDYAAGLNPGALEGRRLGVSRIGVGGHAPTDRLFESALDDLRAAGAELVDAPAPTVMRELGAAVGVVMRTEFKAGVERYLADAAVEAKTLADLIAFNRNHGDRELSLFGQELFEQSEMTTGLADPAYLDALATARRLSGPEGIDAMLRSLRVDALVMISGAPAWLTDPTGASRAAQVDVITTMPAAAGYPHLTVPMGLALGLPVGLSFIGGAWADADILAMGYAFEQIRRRRSPPTYLASISARPRVAGAFARGVET